MLSVKILRYAAVLAAPSIACEYVAGRQAKVPTKPRLLMDFVWKIVGQHCEEKCHPPARLSGPEDSLSEREILLICSVSLGGSCCYQQQLRAAVEMNVACGRCNQRALCVVGRDRLERHA